MTLRGANAARGRAGTIGGRGHGAPLCLGVADDGNGLGAVVVVLMIAAEILIALDHELRIANTVAGPASALTFAVVGVVVARHQAGNPVGWIVILVTLLTTLTVGGGAYAMLSYRLGHLGSRWPRRRCC